MMTSSRWLLWTPEMATSVQLVGQSLTLWSSDCIKLFKVFTLSTHLFYPIMHILICTNTKSKSNLLHYFLCSFIPFNLVKCLIFSYKAVFTLVWMILKLDISFHDQSIHLSINPELLSQVSGLILQLQFTNQNQLFLYALK